MTRRTDPLAGFHPPVEEWFRASFLEPTPAQAKGWPPILDGRSTLLLAPTGSGKTLAAFLAAIDRLLFAPEPPRGARCRVLYVSPLKALAVDVERNLRSPIAGIAAAARRRGDPIRVPRVAIRSGDTPAAERVRIARDPPDILITTPESFYLILTSSARRILEPVETVIVDEIHSLVPTKRGTHLALSLERLEALRGKASAPLQRIGLSATQRPLAEVARFLGGGTLKGRKGVWKPRDVEIVDAGSRKRLDLTIEVPVDDMARLGPPGEMRPGAAGPRSIWPSIHPRLVQLIRGHRSTMVFVNSRRLAERLAASLNETAGAEIALAHHGSIARETRLEIEDKLKRGELPAIVATSSMELGIDMSAVDLVIQIEAPPSVASGMQRIGRASHSVGAVSKGVIFPKYRGDLLACAAATASMVEGKVEETFYPRNPLDVLAQQVVAMTSMESMEMGDLHALVRRAAPFADLPRSAFEGVLDMLSGRHASDELAALRPRITWDRSRGILRARQGARRVAVLGGGTIPDRGLYGVFLSRDDPGRSRRVGELDEEMVFESRPGDVFVLGASSWRIEEITHDRVLVTPAPGEPGKMPFWHGDRPGRPLEFGKAIGELARRLSSLPRAEAAARLRDLHGLDERAIANLLAYLEDQAKSTGVVPSDRAIVIERYLDEVGDWRVCVLSPFGARVHAPWAVAVRSRLGRELGMDVDALWSDDGMVFRLPESDSPPDPTLFLPAPDDAEDLIDAGLAGTSLFAAHFRENAARALLLPRRQPGRRAPLWAQRKRSADLLAVASRFGSFPIILETYRECLRDVFDLPGLLEILRDIEDRRIRVVTVDSRTPSPFAGSILFSYVANFIYDGDAPLAERRAQALSVDQAQLRELLGEAELRELLDLEAIESLQRQLQRLDADRSAKHADGLHDMLLDLGDLTEDEIKSRCSPAEGASPWLDELARDGRIISFRLAGDLRHAAAEDAARFRDALGIAVPPGLPAPFLEAVGDPLGDLVSRYARTHGPFLAEAAALRLGLGIEPVLAALERLAAAGRVAQGEFLPGGRGREWCSLEVLRTLKRRSLARLRREVEPVEPAALGRLLLEWQGVGSRRAGPEALLSVLQQLQGCPLHASVLESEVLPARLSEYQPADLDALCAQGELIWRGLEPLGPRDGKIALYLRGEYALLAPPPAEAKGELAARVRSLLESRGAVFFSDLLVATGAFSGDLLRALWDLVWAGEATNDTLAPLRSFLRRSSRGGRPGRSRNLRFRRTGPPGSEGRWSLLPGVPLPGNVPSETQRRAALARCLLDRYGVLTREAAHAEGIPGGFSAVYQVLKAMEESGKARRGYFVTGLGAAQFALPGADDRLRALRKAPEESSRALRLSAADPASPYGAALPWPQRAGARAERRAGARVFLLDGELVAYSARSEVHLLTFFPSSEPDRSRAAAALARALAAPVEAGGRRAALVTTVDGRPPGESALGPHLVAAGFVPGSHGYLKRSG